jgi:predicted kinase
MSQLIIPVGIPGCGKSTYAETFFDGSDDRIWSTDALRANLGDVNDQSQNDEIFDKFHRGIYKDLCYGHRVFADATNLTQRARHNLLDVARRVSVEAELPEVAVHLIVFMNPDQAILRNSRRERVVPQDAMLRMLENYERSRLDLMQERPLYDTITEIRSF